MNKDQLEKAKNLAAALERLTAQKDAWEQCNRVDDLTLKSAKNNSYRINCDYVNFELLQTLTLDTINKKIATVQKEFDEL